MVKSPWGKPYYFGSPTVEIHRGWIVALVFEIVYFLALLGLLGFLMKEKPARNTPNKIPFVSLLSSLATNALAAFLSTISLFFNVFQSTVTQRYVVLLMIQTLSQMTAFVLMFFVFYRILFNYLERISTSTERPFLMDALHYFILGILGIISAVKAILYIVVLAQNVNQSYSGLTSTYLNISASQEIIYWLASLELVGCAAFVMVKTGSLEFSRRSGLAWIFLGSLFFYGVHFFYAIIAIRYNLEMANTPSSLIAGVPTVIFTICVLGAYAGIFGSCMQLYKRSCVPTMSEPIKLENITKRPVNTYVSVDSESRA
ncbi:hypothetical protein VTN77DRAFT_5218 [Rasamsonia byssochlamydoides]|uniref:uncharacterized protein n=1 Tax=Rasamsonia byssochlamydoides TaxID=89139 RepID=UPI0037439019